MMKSLLFALMIGLSLATTAGAEYSFRLSTSGIDPDATGASSTLTLQNVGDTGSLYVWVSSGGPTETLTGLSLSVLSSNQNTAVATSHSIENPSGLIGPRWSSIFVQPGAFDESDFLVSNSNAAVFFTESGLSTTGPADFVLHSEIQVEALAAGATQLELVEGGLGISEDGGAFDLPVSPDRLNFGSGSISVVPEPGSGLLGVGALLGMLCHRRRTR